MAVARPTRGQRRRDASQTTSPPIHSQQFWRNEENWMPFLDGRDGRLARHIRSSLSGSTASASPEQISAARTLLAKIRGKLFALNVEDEKTDRKSDAIRTLRAQISDRDRCDECVELLAPLFRGIHISLLRSPDSELWVVAERIVVDSRYSELHDLFLFVYFFVRNMNFRIVQNGMRHILGLKIHPHEDNAVEAKKPVIEQRLENGFMFFILRLPTHKIIRVSAMQTNMFWKPFTTAGEAIISDIRAVDPRLDVFGALLYPSWNDMVRKATPLFCPEPVLCAEKVRENGPLPAACVKALAFLRLNEGTPNWTKFGMFFPTNPMTVISPAIRGLKMSMSSLQTQKFGKCKTHASMVLKSESSDVHRVAALLSCLSPGRERGGGWIVVPRHKLGVWENLVRTHTTLTIAHGSLPRRARPDSDAVDNTALFITDAKHMPVGEQTVRILVMEYQTLEQFRTLTESQAAPPGAAAHRYVRMVVDEATELSGDLFKAVIVANCRFLISLTNRYPACIHYNVRSQELLDVCGAFIGLHESQTRRIEDAMARVLVFDCDVAEEQHANMAGSTLRFSVPVSDVVEATMNVSERRAADAILRHLELLAISKAPLDAYRVMDMLSCVFQDGVYQLKPCLELFESQFTDLHTVELERSMTKYWKLDVVSEWPTNVEQDGKQNTCDVCYESCAHENNKYFIVFPCRHAFCVKCVDSIHARGERERHIRCPSCRGECAWDALKRMVPFFALSASEPRSEVALYREIDVPYVGKRAKTSGIYRVSSVSTRGSLSRKRRIEQHPPYERPGDADDGDDDEKDDNKDDDDGEAQSSIAVTHKQICVDRPAAATVVPDRLLVPTACPERVEFRMMSRALLHHYRNVVSRSRPIYGIVLVTEQNSLMARFAQRVVSESMGKASVYVCGALDRGERTSLDAIRMFRAQVQKLESKSGDTDKRFPPVLLLHPSYICATERCAATDLWYVNQPWDPPVERELKCRASVFRTNAAEVTVTVFYPEGIIGRAFRLVRHSTDEMAANHFLHLVLSYTRKLPDTCGARIEALLRTEHLNADPNIWSDCLLWGHPPCFPAPQVQHNAAPIQGHIAGTVLIRDTPNESDSDLLRQYSREGVSRETLFRRDDPHNGSGKGPLLVILSDGSLAVV